MNQVLDHIVDSLKAARGRRRRKERKQEWSDYVNERQKKQRGEKRDIAADLDSVPDVSNAARHERCRLSLQAFCEKYFSTAFYLPWSPDHLKVISKIEQAVHHGGQFAMAMPRGSGKTTLTEIAVIWSILYGHRVYPVIIAANADKAERILQSISVTLETNDAILEDFRRVVFPIWELNHIHNRAPGQTYKGVPTRLCWKRSMIVLPTIPGSPASGSVISVTGLKGGGIRGQKYKTADGRNLRPDLALIDDPQTTESAYSPSQNQRRYSLLAGDVLGMAGPRRKIAAVMCCTVIAQGDMADQILKHADWHGERTKLIYKFPTNQKLWDEYAQVRTHDLLNGGTGSLATEFYRAHQVDMDDGAEVAWRERYNDDELSAVQHCMNLLFRDEASFWSEYQNEPKTSLPEKSALKPEEVMRKANGLARMDIPKGSIRMTAFVDVHDALIYYAIAAFSSDGTAHVADCGAFPDQGRAYFTLREAKSTLARRYQGAGKEAAILRGLTDILGNVLAREFRSVDGQTLQVAMALVDSGYFPEIVFQAIRGIGRLEVVRPSAGKGITASAKPFVEYDPKRNRHTGLHWWVSKESKAGVVNIDVNWWKSLVADRVRTQLGDRGGLTIWGGPHEHRMFADHFAAEYPVRTQGRGRELDEWKQRPGTDNHLFDCIVGCFAAASMCGVTFGGMKANQVGAASAPLVLSDIQRRKRCQ